MFSNAHMRPMPSDLPWTTNCYLVLDGVGVPSLPQRLYQWSDNPVFEALYSGTDWHELLDISPCVISVDGLNDKILQAFLANAAQEWGYLVFTDAGADVVVRHLRWLLQVETPEQRSVLLRLADPAVAHQLLAIGNPGFYGPIEHVCLPDGLEETWHQHQRSGANPDQDYVRPYRLSSSEMAKLEEVSFRQAVVELDEHMRTFFPDYQSALRGQERYRHLHALAEQAYRRNLCSKREILLFANIFGFLGERALERHPAIAERLNAASPQLPEERVEQAAYLAEQHAKAALGISS